MNLSKAKLGTPHLNTKLGTPPLNGTINNHHIIKKILGIPIPIHEPVRGSEAWLISPLNQLRGPPIVFIVRMNPMGPLVGSKN